MCNTISKVNLKYILSFLLILYIAIILLREKQSLFKICDCLIKHLQMLI